MLGALLALSPVAVTAQEPAKANLREVTDNLDMDGHYFMAKNIDGDLAKIASLLNDWAKTSGKKTPESVDAEKMLKDMICKGKRCGKKYGKRGCSRGSCKKSGTSESAQ